jgi:transposase InsO family protein
MLQEYRRIVGSKNGDVKLYTELKNNMITNDFNLGIDKFYRILRYYNLLIPRRKNYHVTTNSKHQFRKYKNLIKDQIPTKPEQLWVTDITYFKTEKGHNYLALVTDTYSKQIMGYKLGNHIKTSLYTEALAMAIKNRKHPNEKLIHHSGQRFSILQPYLYQFC